MLSRRREPIQKPSLSLVKIVLDQALYYFTGERLEQLALQEEEDMQVVSNKLLIDVQSKVAALIDQELIVMGLPHFTKHVDGVVDQDQELDRLVQATPIKRDFVLFEEEELVV